MSKLFLIVFTAVSVLLSSEALAQEGKGKPRFDKEAFQAEKNAFITAEVGLTPEEAAVFIPLCNEMHEKMFAAGRTCRHLSKELRHKSSPTDDDYAKANEACIEAKIKETALEKEYYEKFKAILSPEKLYKYRIAEYKFARKFMGRRDEGPGRK